MRKQCSAVSSGLQVRLHAVRRALLKCAYGEIAIPAMVIRAMFVKAPVPVGEDAREAPRAQLQAAQGACQGKPQLLVVHRIRGRDEQRVARDGQAACQWGTRYRLTIQPCHERVEVRLGVVGPWAPPRRRARREEPGQGVLQASDLLARGL